MFHAPFTQTQLPPDETQCPATQVALRDGGSSQWAATHLHCPPSESQWPDITTYPWDGAGPKTWESAVGGGLRLAELGSTASASAQIAADAAAARTIRILEFIL